MKAGWRETTLGEQFDITSSKRVFKAEWTTSGVPFYRAREIVKLAKFGEVKNNLFISEEMYGEYSAKFGAPVENDIIVTGVGTLGICYLVKDSDRFYFKDGNCIWLKNGSGHIFPRFVEYAFKANFMRDQIDNSNGATVETYTIIKAKQTRIPLPPLEEQKRIVAVLDAAFEGLDRARAHTEANLQNARDLFESGLDAAFNADDGVWEIRQFGDTELLNIVDGDRGKNYPKKSDFHSEGHCLFLNTKNVRPDGFNFDRCQFIDEEKDGLLRKGKLEPRDVLLTTRGTIGNIAIFDDSVPFDNIRINSGMIILRPNEDKLLAEYLFEVLRSGFVKSQIGQKTSGAAQPQLPIKTLVKIGFPVPISKDEQSKLVNLMKTLSVKTDELIFQYQAKLIDLDDLRQSLLQKAFAGELT